MYKILFCIFYIYFYILYKLKLLKMHIELLWIEHNPSFTSGHSESNEENPLPERGALIHPALTRFLLL